MIDSLQRLAARIDREWTAAGEKLSAFPAIAARILTDAQPHRDYDLGSLAQWTLASRTFPPACNPFGPAGPPAFTVWSNDRFFVNVYVYMTPEVVIHDHDFAGTFANLSGTTIHATYAFDAAERVAPALHLGDLAMRDVEVVRTGDVRKIDPGRRFIHQVWHVDQPTVVLVVRTGARSAPRPQFQYLRAGLATEVFRDDALSVDAPERFAYARKMAQCLIPSGGEVAYLKQLLQRESPWNAAWHLLQNWRHLRSIGALDELLRIGARHQGSWFSNLSDAGSEVDLFNSIQWAELRAVEERITLALLLTFRGWHPMREWLARLLPDAPPEERFVDTLRGLGEAGAIPLHLGPEALAMLTCALKSDGDRNAWRREVRDAFEVRDRSAWATAKAIDRKLREHRLLQPLFASAS